MEYVLVEEQTPVACPVMLPGVTGVLETVTAIVFEVALPQLLETTQL
jgi:hypothetical protein